MKAKRAPKAPRIATGITAIVAALLLLAADAPPTFNPRPEWVLSNTEASGDRKLTRDCGYSHPVPDEVGENIWVFCDTLVRTPGRRLPELIPGSTAARGPQRPGQVPRHLSEIPTPPAPMLAMPHDDGPQPFLPQPTGLHRRDGTPCKPSDDVDDAYPASWTTGLAEIPGTARLLLTYVDVCVEAQWDFVVSRMGIVEYTPDENRLGEPTVLFDAPAGGTQLQEPLQLGSPVFADDHLHLFASVCHQYALGECQQGEIYLARAPSPERSAASAYRFRQDGRWKRDPSLATNIVPGATPSDVHVSTFDAVGRDLVLIETTSLGGHYRVWEADHPTGRWRETDRVRRLPGCQPAEDVVDFCRALIGQPALSTTDELALTYFSVEEEHIRIVTAHWGRE